MNADRFSAQLRQHLLDTANERAADGQLPALAAAVARTAQRRTLVPRLAWLPERTWGMPSPALRTGLSNSSLTYRRRRGPG